MSSQQASWAVKAALTTRELDTLSSISSMFQKKRAVKKEPHPKEELKVEHEIAEIDSIADKIDRAREKLAAVDA